MRMVVDGQELDVHDHGSATLQHLIDLQQATRDWTPGGLRMSSLDDLHAQALARHPLATARWMTVVIYLSRRAAGHTGTWTQLVDCTPRWIRDRADTDPEPILEGPATTGARWPGDTRSRARPASQGRTSWPFDDVSESVSEWLLAVGHHWPGITPLNVYDLPAAWWARYVRAAQDLVRASTKTRERP